MELHEIKDLLDKIEGCTFASLDAVTKPAAGVRRHVTNERVILFTNKKSSGYENMVRRRLEEAGLDPDAFTLGPLPWGERVEGTPLIYHNGAYYIQTILLAPGEVQFFIGTRKVNPEDVAWATTKDVSNQGLPEGRQVLVNTYRLDSITAIRLMGEEVKAAGPSKAFTTPVSGARSA